MSCASNSTSGKVSAMPVLERTGAIGLRRHEVRRAALAGLVAAVVLAGCTSSGSDGAAGGSSVATVPSTAPPTSAPEGTDAWRSTEIVDGDTLYVSGSAGELEVRIIGINTPESGECFYDEATEALAELVDGNELVLVADRSDVDQFGRALRYVETTDGVDVGAELVANGFAIARRYPPDDARADRYAELQRDAQREERGLWASDACGSSDLGGVEIVIDVNADAPGDDGVNLNGEWVRFTNAGAEAIDLDGWEVADESASHRYTFSDLRLEPGAEVTLFSGCGPDDETSRYWCVSGSAVWNNSGDTVFLRDRTGNIVALLSYGDSG
jgi:endonuclease YncB( thermonuclease family)